MPYVIALNRFPSDTVNEINCLIAWADTNKHPIALSEVYQKGSSGGVDLAKIVLDLAMKNNENDTILLYSLNASLTEKIKIITTKLYGANNVVYSEKALIQIEQATKYGWDKLPVCMAKTPLSLSDNPKLLGRPTDFTITIRDIKPSIGAGFMVALTGDVMTMPGLPKKGAYENMDVVDNKIIGLF
jgi:formate--tetrahydrofolate ligase